MDNKGTSDPQLISQLEQLHETESRNPHTAAVKRAAFLTEARKLSLGVSTQPHQRLNEWMAAITTFLAAPRKEKGVSMFSTVLTLIVVLSLAFGGGTVAAAQISMPDDALYQIKLLSEDARLSISADQETQLQLSLEFAERRMEEIQTMLQMGETPPETVMTRLQNQMDYALRLAINMPDEQLQSTLLQVQTRLQQQDQTMTQLQLNLEADPALLQIQDRVKTMLQQQLQLCQTGLTDPDLLREQLRIREQDQLQQQLQDGIQNQNQNGEQNQNQEGEMNQNQNQNGTNVVTPTIEPVETSTAGAGNGLGDGACPNCPSGDCVCDGTGKPTTPNGGNGNKP